MNHEDRALSDTLKSRMYDRKYVIFELFLALKRAELFLQSDQPQSVTTSIWQINSGYMFICMYGNY